MEKPNKAVFSLDTFHVTNWDIKSQPVAVLNEASTLHERVAHCWGMAMDMLDICGLLNESESTDVARVSGLMHGRLTPLVELLHLIGSDTYQASLASSKAIRQGAGNE